MTQYQVVIVPGLSQTQAKAIIQGSHIGRESPNWETFDYDPILGTVKVEVTDA